MERILFLYQFGQAIKKTVHGGVNIDLNGIAFRGGVRIFPYTGNYGGEIL